MNRRMISPVLLLGATILVTACGSSTVQLRAQADADYDYTVSRLQSRDAVADYATPYTKLWQVLPNVDLKGRAGVTQSVTRQTIVGKVVGVEKGKGFFASAADDSKSIVVDFDSPRAHWRTVHLLVQPTESLAGSEKALPATVKVGIAFGAQADAERMINGLGELGNVVLPVLPSSKVFRYDSSVLSLAEGSSLIVSVADNGALSLPFESDKSRSAQFLDDTQTLSELRTFGARQPVTIAAS